MIKSKSHASALSSAAETFQEYMNGPARGTDYALFGSHNQPLHSSRMANWSSDESWVGNLEFSHPSSSLPTIPQQVENSPFVEYAMKLLSGVSIKDVVIGSTADTVTISVLYNQDQSWDITHSKEYFLQQYHSIYESGLFQSFHSMQRDDKIMNPTHITEYLSQCLAQPNACLSAELYSLLDNEAKSLSVIIEMLRLNARAMESDKITSEYKMKAQYWQEKFAKQNTTLERMQFRISSLEVALKKQQDKLQSANSFNSDGFGSPNSFTPFEIGMVQEFDTSQIQTNSPAESPMDMHNVHFSPQSGPDTIENTEIQIPWQMIPTNIPSQTPLSTSPIGLLDCRAERLISYVKPSVDSESKRKKVFFFVLSMLKRALGAQAYPTGSVPLRCYVPDEELCVSAFVCHGQEGKWFIKVSEALCSLAAKHDGQDSNSTTGPPMDETQACEVTQVSFMPSLRLIRCIVDGIRVKISANNLEALGQVAFFEEMDRVVRHTHLFKTSLLLLKSWAVYENKDENSNSIMTCISEPALCTMLIGIFNQYHERIFTPIQALATFFLVYSGVDWKNQAVTITGVVPLSTVQQYSPLQQLEESTGYLLGKDFVSQYAERYVRARHRNEKKITDGVSFQQEHFFQIAALNIMDPLDNANNLANGTTSRQHIRFVHLLRSGAIKFRDMLVHLANDTKIMNKQQQENALQTDSTVLGIPQNAVQSFDALFKNTMNRFRTGNRPDTDSKQNTPVTGSIHHSKTMDWSAPGKTLWGKPDNGPGSISSSIRKVASFPANINNPNYVAMQDASISQQESVGSTDLLEGNLSEMWSRLRYCSLLLDSEVTAPALLSLSTEILAEKGPLPVGEIGKMLQEATSNPNISATLKEKFGGLKKFLEQYMGTFLISSDHKFNPKVYLLASLSEAQIQGIKNGLSLSNTQTSATKKRKGGRKPKNGVPTMPSNIPVNMRQPVNMHHQQQTVQANGQMSNLVSGMFGHVGQPNQQNPGRPMGHPQHPGMNFVPQNNQDMYGYYDQRHMPNANVNSMQQQYSNVGNGIRGIRGSASMVDLSRHYQGSNEYHR